MRLKEEKIRETIQGVKDNDAKGWHSQTPYQNQYWSGYLNALRSIVKMPPDDEIYDDEDFD